MVYTVIYFLLIQICWSAVLPKIDDPYQAELTSANNRTKPQQVHISLGDDLSKMVVTWSTVEATNISLVMYGVDSLKAVHLGKITKFTNGPGHVQYIHTAVMTKLLPDTLYQYRVGSGDPGEMSSLFKFKTIKDGLNWSPRFCVYGDMGLQNPQSLPRIQHDLEQGIYDVILHVGDFAYNLDSNFGDIGDQFMRMIEPVASQIPYMTTPGNHENAANFSNYKNRFRMPNNNNENMFYSYNVGPVHIISVSTEFYFYLYYGVIQMFNQFDWLVEDLKTANLPENRAKQPWIIFLGHRPIYCSNNDTSDCTKKAAWLRYGIPFVHILGLEDVLYQYGVDLAIWAHEHSYERMWPVYGEKVVNSSTPEQPYLNPFSTVHVVSGSAGCDEDHGTFSRDVKPYSAFHSTDYGYSRIIVQNRTHLQFEQVSDDQGGKVIDSFWLIRDHHGSFIK